MSTNTERALLRIKLAEIELAAATVELQREQDKDKIRWYDGMPVLVRDDPNGSWSKRFLKQVCTDRPSIYECYNNGGLPRFKDENVYTCYWKECKPNYEMPSMLVWIPNTGEMPKGVKRVIIKYRNGDIGAKTNPEDYVWSIGDHLSIKHILEYAVIERN